MKLGMFRRLREQVSETFNDGATLIRVFNALVEKGDDQVLISKVRFALHNTFMLIKVKACKVIKGDDRKRFEQKFSQ